MLLRGYPRDFMGEEIVEVNLTTREITHRAMKLAWTDVQHWTSAKFTGHPLPVNQIATYIWATIYKTTPLLVHVTLLAIYLNPHALSLDDSLGVGDFIPCNQEYQVNEEVSLIISTI